MEIKKKNKKVFWKTLTKALGVMITLAVSFSMFFLFGKLYELEHGSFFPLIFFLIPLYIINLLTVELLQNSNGGSLI